MQALNDYVILRYSKEKDQKNGVLVSNVSKSKGSRAEVVSVGDDVKKVKVGDTVAFDSHVPRQLPDEELLVIREKYIFAKI